MKSLSRKWAAFLMTAGFSVGAWGAPTPAGQTHGQTRATFVPACVRPPLLGRASRERIAQVISDFMKPAPGRDCPTLSDPFKFVCIPAASNRDIRQANLEAKAGYDACQGEKPPFVEPVTNDCSCSCTKYLYKGVNFCEGASYRGTDFSSKVPAK